MAEKKPIMEIVGINITGEKKPKEQGKDSGNK